MKKFFAAIVLLPLLSAAFAQDYYLTADKNKSPLVLDKITDAQNVLKAQKKDSKYRFVLLYITNGEGVFMLVPTAWRTELTFDGLGLYDPANPSSAINVNIKEISATPDEDLLKFKKEVQAASGECKPETKLIINGKVSTELLCSTKSGSSIVAYILDYKKNILFLSEGNKATVSARTSFVRQLIGSLGVVQTKDNPLAAQAAPQSQIAPAAEEAEEAPIAAAPAAQDYEISSIKVTPQGAKLNKVSFKCDGVHYSFVLDSAVKTVLEDGHLYLNGNVRGKNVMFMEAVNGGSKDFYAGLIKTYNEGRPLKSDKPQQIKLGQNNVRLIKKNALNKSGGNYFFKQGCPFVVSYIADLKDNAYFDKTAKAVISSLNQEAI